MNRLIFLLCLIPSLSFAQLFEEEKPITRKDSLRGQLSPERTCFDVFYYDLAVDLFPETKSITGKNTIHFLAKEKAEMIQLDLYANMEVDSIFDQKGRAISYQREENAIFLSLPKKLRTAKQYSVTVHFHGKPIEAKMAPWDGGFVWSHDQWNNPLAGVACQGMGASLWWPCKDHPSDEPDSMSITLTAPSSLKAISNGRLRKETALSEDRTSWEWFVQNPINAYNATFYLGNFTHFNDSLGDLSLDYYVLPEHLESAKEQFKQTQLMLEAFEHYFGPYPFPEDGFKMVEAPYLGMEHQSAIAYGNEFQDGYLGRASSKQGLDFDFIIIHEGAHEWFGNSLSADDLADLWIQEAFASYDEALYVEYHFGREKAEEYLFGERQKVNNQSPIQGPSGVAREGDPDMYAKGTLMLHTLRNVVDNDSLWFGWIKSLCLDYRHQSINYEKLVTHFNRHMNQDYSWFFAQYVKQAKLPVLKAQFVVKNGITTLYYSWDTEVKSFRMPIKVFLGSEESISLRPMTTPQEIKVTLTNPYDFKVEDGFFMEVKIGVVYLK